MSDKLKDLSMFFLLYNEEDNIRPLLDSALTVAQEVAETYELLPVIFEGSTDRTIPIAQELAASNPCIRVIVQPRNRPGMGNAIRVGFENARYSHIFYADGDNQFDLQEFKKFLPQIGEPSVIAGYRIKRQDPKFRLLSSRVYNIIVKTLFGVKERDVDCAFRYVHKHVLDKLTLVCATGLGTTEILVKARRAGFPIHEVGVTHYPRTAGQPIFEVKSSWNILNIPKPKVVVDLLKEMSILQQSLKSQTRG